MFCLIIHLQPAFHLREILLKTGVRRSALLVESLVTLLLEFVGWVVVEGKRFGDRLGGA